MDYYLGKEANVELKTLFKNVALEQEYNEWNKIHDKVFERMLIVGEDPYKFIGELMAASEFDYTKEEDRIFADNIKRALFYVKKIYDDRRKICEQMYHENTSSKKVEIINALYFTTVQNYETTNIVHSILQHVATIGMVVWGAYDTFDMQSWYDLSEALANRYTIEDVYLYFTLWRLTKEKKHIKKALKAADRFIIQYMYAFADMPGASTIREQVENRKIVDKLAIIISKFLISTKGAEIVFEKATENGVWSDECYVKEINSSNMITSGCSYYNILITGFFFGEKGEEYVKDKAMLHNTYNVLCKANDILLILCEMARIFDEFSEEEKKGILHLLSM